MEPGNNLRRFKGRTTIHGSRKPVGTMRDASLLRQRGLPKPGETRYRQLDDELSPSSTCPNDENFQGKVVIICINAWPWLWSYKAWHAGNFTVLIAVAQKLTALTLVTSPKNIFSVCFCFCPFAVLSAITGLMCRYSRG